MKGETNEQTFENEHGKNLDRNDDHSDDFDV
jgi:hypothetical protein